MRFHPALFNQVLGALAPTPNGDLPQFRSSRYWSPSNGASIPHPDGMEIGDTLIRNHNYSGGNNDDGNYPLTQLGPLVGESGVQYYLNAPAGFIAQGSYPASGVMAHSAWIGVWHIRRVAVTKFGIAGSFSGFRTVVPNTVVLFMTSGDENNYMNWTGVDLEVYDYLTTYGNDYRSAAAIINMETPGVVPEVTFTQVSSGAGVYGTMVFLEPYPDPADVVDPDFLFTDPFTQPDGYVFANNSQYQTVSNFTVPTSGVAVSGAGTGYLIEAVPNLSNDMEAEIELAASVTDFAGVILRSTGAADGYRAGWSSQNGGEWQIGDGLDHTLNVLHSVSEATIPGDGDVIKARVVNDIINLYFNGALVATVAGATTEGGSYRQVGVLTQGINSIERFDARRGYADFWEPFIYDSGAVPETNWRQLDPAQPYLVVNSGPYGDDTVVPTTSGQGGLVSKVPVSWSDSGEVELFFNNFTYGGVLIRLGVQDYDDLSVGPYYWINHDRGGTDHWDLYFRDVGGADTLLATQIRSQPDNKFIKFRKLGSTLYVYEGSTLFMTYDHGVNAVDLGPYVGFSGLNLGTSSASGTYVDYVQANILP